MMPALPPTQTLTPQPNQCLLCAKADIIRGKVPAPFALPKSFSGGKTDIAAAVMQEGKVVNMVLAVVASATNNKNLLLHTLFTQ